MARTTKATQRRRKRTQPDARGQQQPKPKRKRSGLTPTEQTMFFPRLRRQAKWMFVFLALMFAAGFVVFNVGSGGGGTGIGDLLLNNSGSSSNTPSAKDAREKIAKNAADFAAYRELATALETEGDTTGAIAALERYTSLRPRDGDALRELAGLYLSRADGYRRDAQVAQLAAASALPGLGFELPANSVLSQAIGRDPITQAVATRVNTGLNEVFGKMDTAYKQAVSVYTELAKVQPKDPSVQLELAQAAEASNQPDTAVTAYKRFLELVPDDPNAPAIKQRIKELGAAAAAANSTAVASSPTG